MLAAPVIGLPGTTRPAAAAEEPLAGFDLARLAKLDDPKLTPSRRAELGLTLLGDEIAAPTPRPGPPYTGFKTHDYVLARIIRKLVATETDRDLLRKRRETEAPGELRDCLTLYLMLDAPTPPAASKTAATDKGSDKPVGPTALAKQQRDEVTAYLQDVKHPLRLRELAAEALGVYAIRERDPSVGETLAFIARRDPHSSRRETPTGFVTVYPVKRAAATAIGKMMKSKLSLPSYVTGAAEAGYEVQPRRP
ncbi:MAG: hypothetical protein K0Q72_1370 [Armatimonadetes bacterium]|nr:hypothetical protein [Armatimonadota bacterium]